MKFKIYDRVRVVKSELEDYRGLEGVVLVARPAYDSATFNTYVLRIDDGRQLDFFEFQLELALPDR